MLAYNLGNFLRRLALSGSVQHWSLRSIQVKLIKIGAKVVRRARQVISQMAEVAVPEELFAEILQRIRAALREHCACCLPASHPCYLTPGNMTAKRSPNSYFADKWPSRRVIPGSLGEYWE